MEYKVNDTRLVASTFIPFVNQIWKGDIYNMEKSALLVQAAAHGRRSMRHWNALICSMQS